MPDENNVVEGAPVEEATPVEVAPAVEETANAEVAPAETADAPADAPLENATSEEDEETDEGAVA